MVFGGGGAEGALGGAVCSTSRWYEQQILLTLNECVQGACLAVSGAHLWYLVVLFTVGLLDWGNRHVPQVPARPRIIDLLVTAHER